MRDIVLLKSIERHRNAPQWSAWKDRIGCESCAHLRALRVDRSYTQYQCGCSECKHYLDWTHRGNSRPDCSCFAKCTREQFEHMADVWSASAEALRQFFAWPRKNKSGEGKTPEDCGVIRGDMGYDVCQVLHCAPFLVIDVAGEIPKVYDNDGVRVLDMYRIGPRMPYERFSALMKELEGISAENNDAR